MVRESPVPASKECKKNACARNRGEAGDRVQGLSGIRLQALYGDAMQWGVRGNDFLNTLPIQTSDWIVRILIDTPYKHLYI